MDEFIILISTNDGEIAYALENCLQGAGMLLLRTSNNEQTIDVLRRKRPNVVFLDIKNLVPDRWSTLSILKKESNIPVILVTRLAHDIDILTGLQLGADDYVVIPFNPAEIAARVKVVLQKIQTSHVENHRPEQVPRGSHVGICDTRSPSSNVVLKTRLI